MLYIVHCWFFQIPMVNGYVLECIGCIGASCSVPIPVLGPRFPTRCGSLASNSSAALDTFDLNSFSCSSATAPFLRLAYDTEKIRKMIRSPVDPPNGGLSDWTAKKTWLIMIIYHYTLYTLYIIYIIIHYTLYIFIWRYQLSKSKLAKLQNRPAVALDCLRCPSCSAVILCPEDRQLLLSEVSSCGFLGGLQSSFRGAEAKTWDHRKVCGGELDGAVVHQTWPTTVRLWDDETPLVTTGLSLAEIAANHTTLC